MSGLPAGTVVALPDLPGRWGVWSPAADSPGAHFFVPNDDEARGVGIKYAVVRVVYPKAVGFPTFTLIRTDPHRPDLLPEKKGKR